MEGCKIIHKVAIIGGGPKGMYGFERLAAWLNRRPPLVRTEIHIFNRSDSFGAGDIYRTDQPSYLLMNNPVAEVNMWPEKTPPPVVPQSLTFSEWLRHVAGMNLSRHDYATRAMAGHYLSHGFDSILSNLPENVYGKFIVAEVVDIYIDSGQYSLTVKGEEDNNVHFEAERYDHVLLATGHPMQRESEQEVLFQSFVEKHKNAGYIPFVYPVETKFSTFPANCSVAVKGMGLTFVDAVLALTEGKGGRFVRDNKSDKLVYEPSGREPKVIYPYSRSGLPMFPRRSIAMRHAELTYFTRNALQRLESGKKLDFEQQIWPLLRQEMIHAYYDTAISRDGFPEGLSACEDFKEVGLRIEEYHKNHSSEIRFDPERFMDPVQGNDLQNGDDQNQYLKSLYNSYLHEARKGELTSPLAAVTAVWRKASSLFCEVYSFGGLTPESQRYFDKSIRGKLIRITYGPPVESGEKLYALMDCGMLNFGAARNPDLMLDEGSGQFILESRSNNIRYPVQYLVDARIPKVSLDNDPGPLFRNLLNRGLITVHENRLDEETYRTGAVNITRQGFVIDRNNHINRGIAVTGTPTEGITFDNDSLSRDRNNFVDGWAEFISREYEHSGTVHHAI